MPPKRAKWTEDNLKAAMAAVERGQLSQRAAADRHGIPRRTLRNHLRTGDVSKRLGRRAIMTKEQEDDLVARIIRFAAIGMPLTPRLIRRQAFVFCEKYNLKHNFNTESGLAGKDWLKLFLKRHPEISRRKAQFMNPGRAQKLNRPIVSQHFEEVKKLYDELDIENHPERLFNMDEKGCRLTIHHQQVVLSQKGVKRLHMIAPEHAENVTIAMCANAVGYYIPPMIIFKGKRLKPEYEENLPPGSLVRMAVKGSMTTQLFIDFIKHLGKHKTPGKILLIFDGASSHLDFEIVEEAENHDIILYCLPSNTTHELQPLDKSINKSYEHFWDQEVLKFLYKATDRKLTKQRFNKIFTKVWSQCMTHQNIVNGFRATGLYPYNPDILPDHAFAPSILTKQDIANPDRSEAMENMSDDEASVHSNSEELTQNDAERSNLTMSDDGTRNIFHGEVRGSSHPHFSVTRDISSDETVCEDRADSPSVFILSSEVHALISQDISRNVLPDQEILQSDLVSQEEANNRTPIKSPQPNVSSDQVLLQSDSVLLQEEANNKTPVKSPQPGCSGIQTTRPVLHSSETETDDEFVNIEAILQYNRTKQSGSAGIHIYSTDDEGNGNWDSEDNIPLRNLVSGKNQRTPFQQLLPTPNYALTKTAPRRKALNYKGQRVTKDLFDRQKKSEKKPKTNNKKTENYTKVSKRTASNTHLTTTKRCTKELKKTVPKRRSKKESKLRN